MSTFNSPPIHIERTQADVYEFLSNFKNFEKLLPEQVVNWKATTDHCSFTITGMADIEMRMGENSPHSIVRYVSEGKSPVGFDLEYSITEQPENISQVEIVLKANLNPMLKMMASRPLKNFVNILSEKLKEVLER